MLILFELTGGFFIFKVLNEHKLLTPENVCEEFCTVEKAKELLKLKYFVKFKTIDDAVDYAICVTESKINPFLRETLESHVAEEGVDTLGVLDEELGYLISSELNIPCVSDLRVVELSRCIRINKDILLGELAKDLQSMRSEVVQRLNSYKLNKLPQLDEGVEEIIPKSVDGNECLERLRQRACFLHGQIGPTAGSTVQYL